MLKLGVVTMQVEVMLKGLVLWIALRLWSRFQKQGHQQHQWNCQMVALVVAQVVAQVVQGSGENMVLASMTFAA